MFTITLVQHCTMQEKTQELEKSKDEIATLKSELENVSDTIQDWSNDYTCN